MIGTTLRQRPGDSSPFDRRSVRSLLFGATATLAGIACTVALHPWLDPLLGGRYPFFAAFAGFLVTLALAGAGWSIVTLAAGFVMSLAHLVPLGELPAGLDAAMVVRATVYWILGLTAARVVHSVGAARRRVRTLAEQARATRRARDVLRRQLLAVTDTATVALLLTDEAQRCTYMNPAAERMLGLDLQALRRDGLHTLVHHHRPDGSHYPAHDCPIALALAHGRTARGEETFIRPDGTFHPVGYAVTPIVADMATIGAVIELRDIADEQRAAAERERLLEMERATNRAKDEFLAMLGHELRNPIGAIMTAAEAIRHLPPDDARVPRLNAIVRRQSTHLNRLIDDLLDLARVTSGKLVLSQRPVDLAEVVQRAVHLLRETGKLHGHRLALRLAPGWVRGDATRLEQVITNLLLNALKFTPAGGGIEVAVAADAMTVRLRVRDEGIGIAPDLLPRVFDPFVQCEQGTERSGGGLGIGLALVRRLVEQHGGTVEAHSAGPGTGTEVIVTLPATAPPAALPAAPPPKPTSLSPRRVLLVEDNDDARHALRLLLETAGHEVHEARDGQTGLAAALETGPDVAIVDLGLPGIDGLELARRLRAAPAGAKMRLVALTGYGQPEDRARTTEAGFDAHLVKPVDEQRLYAALGLGATG